LELEAFDFELIDEFLIDPFGAEDRRKECDGEDRKDGERGEADKQGATPLFNGGWSWGRRGMVGWLS
jgi:hypothetical protein